MLSTSPSVGQRLGRQIDHRTAGDVVHDQRKARGRGHGAEMRDQAALGRLVVVGRDHEDRVHAARLGGPRELDAVARCRCCRCRRRRGTRSPTASTTVRNIAAFSASSSVGDSPVVPATTRPSEPLVDEVLGELGELAVIDREVGVERRHHGGEDRAQAVGHGAAPPGDGAGTSRQSRRFSSPTTVSLRAARRGAGRAARRS